MQHPLSLAVTCLPGYLTAPNVPYNVENQALQFDIHEGRTAPCFLIVASRGFILSIT